MTQLTQSEHKPYLWLPDSWDAGWRAAKLQCAAKAGTATLMFHGDSLSAGEACSNNMTKSFVELTRVNLIQRLGLYADFWPALAYSPNAPGAFNGPPPWSGLLNGNAGSIYYNNGPTAMNFNAAITTSAFQSFTTPYACTALDIIYNDISTQTAQYNIDGGAQQTITCTGGATGPTAITKRIQITGLPNQIHTVQYGWNSGALGFGVAGIVTYQPGAASGLGLTRFAYGGAQAYHYSPANTAQLPDGRIELIQGKNPGSSATNNTGWGFPYQPDLLVVEYGINDCNANLALPAYQTTMDRFCQAARRGKPDASIVFLVPWFGNGNSTDCSFSANGINWSQYAGIMYQLAQQYSAAVVSIHARWGSNPLAQGLCNSATDLHPTDAGHADIASVLTSIL